MRMIRVAVHVHMNSGGPLGKMLLRFADSLSLLSAAIVVIAGAFCRMMTNYNDSACLPYHLHHAPRNPMTAGGAFSALRA